MTSGEGEEEARGTTRRLGTDMGIFNFFKNKKMKKAAESKEGVMDNATPEDNGNSGNFLMKDFLYLNVDFLEIFKAQKNKKTRFLSGSVEKSLVSQTSGGHVLHP